MTTRMTGMEAVTRVKKALEEAGLPRTSKYNGGELTGWTTHFGSTGFSVRLQASGLLCWHMVISGKPHLEYRQVDDLERPVKPEKLNGRIQAALHQVGLEVQEVRCTCWQTMWDDDVDYEVMTAYPAWLEGSTAA